LLSKQTKKLETFSLCKKFVFCYKAVSCKALLKGFFKWYFQGRRQKNFQGGGQRKKRPKNTKKDRKLHYYASSRGGKNGKKTEK